MRTNLNYLLFIFLFFTFWTGYTQYADYAYHQPSLEELGFDYHPSNPLVIDRLINDNTPADPLLYPVIYQDTVKTKWIRTDTGKSLVASAALIGVGLFTYKDSGFMNRVDIKYGINRYLPGFSNDIDDYTQYIPWAATLALDPLGIPSKHKFKRKVSTMATGAAASLIVIQGLKYSIGELRPDGSANNAFPSGHTATAFMGAHIFHKEYGDQSIYYSIGGYFLATFTGIFRQLNDRHWISDVFVGAGLGISLTEFAYWLNGKWWKDKGINEIDIVKKDPNRDRPSYLGVKFGYAGLTDRFDDEDSGISAQDGFTLAVDGAWFFSRNVGIGGESGFQSFPIKVDQDIVNEVASEGYEIEFQPVGNTKNVFGPQFQIDWRKSTLGAKIQAGWARIADTEVFLRPVTNDEPTEEDDIDYASIRPVTKFAWSTGLYYRWLIDERLALNVFVDYNATDLDSSLSYIDDLDNIEDPVYVTEPLTGTFNSWTAGISFNVMIW